VVLLDFNFEGSLSPSPGPQINLVPPCTISLGGPDMRTTKYESLKNFALQMDYSDIESSNNRNTNATKPS
jgi:hypothetical protein